MMILLLLLPSGGGISYSASLEAARSGQIKSATLQETNTALLRHRDGREFEVRYPENVSYADRLDRLGVDVWIKERSWIESVWGLGFLWQSGKDGFSSLSLLGLVLLGALLLWLVFFVGLLYRGRQLVKKRDDKSVETEKPTTFADVAGCKEAIEEISECAAFLKNPESFLSLGAHMPKGIILSGPPGTGKTLLARALAGEAGVSFIDASGSSFVEKYVGVGAKNVRDLFERARREKGAVIFIDEIDALASRRGSDSSAASSERESTLNELLVQMDGFRQDARILVVGASNRTDRLDPAVLRSGRFSRQIEIGLPSRAERQEILELHAANKKFAQDISWSEIAEITSSLSGADLEDILNESAILAARERKSSITKNHILEARIKKVAGPKRKQQELSSKERRVVAYHEAGHALAASLCPEHPDAEHISIRSRNGGAGGLVLWGQKDRSLHYGDDIHQRLIVLLAGRAAEQTVFAKVSSGASSDLDQASQMARQAIEQLGFAKEQSVRDQRQISDRSRNKIDKSVDLALDRAYGQALLLLQKKRSYLDLLAAELLEKEEISGRRAAELLLGATDPATAKRLRHNFAPRSQGFLRKITAARSFLRH